MCVGVGVGGSGLSCQRVDYMTDYLISPQLTVTKEHGL